MEERHHAREPETSPARRALSDDLASSAQSPAEDGGHSGSIRKGCDPFAQSQRGQLQNRRARINQQINKEMRMRAGAENLFRATTNTKVKETVALELSYVNSSLQLLKEELEDLNSNVEVYQTESEAAKAPMIPLGLKETKEADFTAPIQDFICQHYGEDGSLYREEIRELMDLRQAMRTPSRNQTGLDLLMEYYNQLYYLDQRFFPPHRNLGVHFHWYDSLTGVPSCQRALAFEKGSVLFNLGALYTQIGARQDRTTAAGIQRAIDAFQRAAGALNYLKENFSNAPSLDMSGPALCMLVRLMVAQVQECAFESLALGGARDGDASSTSSLRLAQEAARVSDVYLLVQQSMSQPLMKDYVPFSWTSMVQVKVEHFRALSHYFAAVVLCGPTLSEDVSEEAEKAFVHFYVGARAGPPLGRLLRDSQQRRKLGKAHLRHAVMRHEEAMRLHGVCKSFRKMDILQDVLAATHKRSLDKYSELDREDDFDPTLEAPEIRPQSRQKPDIAPPNFAAVRVADIFRRLVDQSLWPTHAGGVLREKPLQTMPTLVLCVSEGPLSVFCGHTRRGPARSVCLPRTEGGLGLTLRGDSPVLVAGVAAGGCAAEAGLREGDYIVSVDGRDCKWAKHAEVVSLLQNRDVKGARVAVVALLSHDAQGEKRAAAVAHSRGKENADQRPTSRSAKGRGPASFLNWNRKKREGARTHRRPGSTLNLPFGDTGATY
ncbi:LOW QUALITY PROTEIN: rhophilin-1 [Hippocampus comes]|uniref:LOW QUALITY PROTEIN: rhophilin-1 n=1 Tax=Hippocampus comes TaxID=109280 RepID=UPI00094F3591|nr:PREDICTED: LOW QUALITY PROTEIN: rhophilin-1 [Hippocampus comes]